MLTTESENCQKCGQKAVRRIAGSCQGYFCESCNEWLFVTTYIEPIKADIKDYKIILQKGDFSNKEQIKLISTVSGINFLQARELLKNEGVKIFEGQAVEVREFSQQLKRLKIEHEIVPDFPYEV